MSPRGIYSRNQGKGNGNGKANVVSITSLSHAAIEEAGQYTSHLTFSFSSQLKRQEQEDLALQSKKLTAAIMLNGYSRLAIGEMLFGIQTLLLPYNGLWGKFLKEFKYRFTPKTAYRWIEGYKNASSALPPTVIKAAMVRGMDITGHSEESPLGVYTKPVSLLPPPANPSIEEAERYLDQLEQTRKEQAKAPPNEKLGDIVEATRADPRFLLKHSFRVARNDMNKLHHKQKRKFLEGLVGMLLVAAGLQGTVSFQPEAIPDDFKQTRGRPKEALAA